MYREEDCLSREEALRLYTQGSTWFSSETGKKGAIVPGQLADMVVLSEDYFSVPEEEIKGIESVLTVMGRQNRLCRGTVQGFGPGAHSGAARVVPHCRVRRIRRSPGPEEGGQGRRAFPAGAPAFLTLP